MPLPHETPPAVNPTPAVLAAVPELTTDRLTLRAPQIGDFDALAGIFMSDRWQTAGAACRRSITVAEKLGAVRDHGAEDDGLIGVMRHWGAQ